MANITETPIDALLTLLNKKGKLELSEITSALNVSPDVVESWAKILENNGIIKISYDFGKMYIELKKETKEQEKAQELLVSSERLNIENELINQKIEIEKYFEKYTQLGDTIKLAEGMFQEKFPEIESKLEAIDKIYRTLQEENVRLENYSKNAEMLYNNVNKKLTDLYSRINSIDINTIKTSEEQINRMRSILSDANKIENELELLSQSKDNAINFIKKGIKEQINILENDIAKIKSNMNNELNTYHNQLNEHLNEIKEKGKEINILYKELSEFKRSENALKKELDESKLKFNDEYSKFNDYITSKGSLLKNEIKDLSNELIKIKEEFGNISKLHDGIKKNKDMLVEFKKEIDKIKDDIDKLSAFIKSIDTEKSVNTKKINIAKAKVKLNEINNKLEELNKKYLALTNGI
ncbi:MAG: hypothetical protein ACP5UN_00750 [Candidatus Micrarchaeia archaeon]